LPVRKRGLPWGDAPSHLRVRRALLQILSKSDKSYGYLKKELLRRYLTNLPFMRRWTEFQREHGAMVKYALEVFEDLRRSNRTLRTKVAARLYGSGIAVDDLLAALSEKGLVAVRRGRTGGVYYPSR